MKRARRRKRRRLAGAFLRRPLAAIALFALALQPCAAQEIDELLRLFGVALPAADIVMLLDASGSMRAHRYGDVRQSVINFTPALTERETLHLRVFGNTVNAPVEGTRREIEDRVAASLPPEPVFNQTDLGMAILKGLDFLEREGASPVQAFFLLTDGAHDPPADSPFSRDFAADPDWQDLRRRAERLCAQRTVFVYGFGLGGQTDVSILRRVFPAQNVEIVTGDATQVAAVLQQVRARLSRTQLRQTIERELSEGRIEAQLARTSLDGNVTEADIPLTVRNSYSHLPARVEGIRVEREGDAEIECVVANAPANAPPLAGGEERRGEARVVLRADLPRWRLGRTARQYRATFRFVPEANFTTQAALEALSARPAAPRVEAATLAVNLSVAHGIPYWLAALPFLVIGAAALWVVAARRRVSESLALAASRQAERKRLAGTLKIWPSHDEAPFESGADLSRYASERLSLAANESGALAIVTPGEESKGEEVARLSAHLVETKPEDGESGTLKFRLEAVGDHRLAYQSRLEWREAAAPVMLCDRDEFQIDERWRLRYDNTGLSTRDEIESA